MCGHPPCYVGETEARAQEAAGSASNPHAQIPHRAPPFLQSKQKVYLHTQMRIYSESQWPKLQL